MDTEWQCMDCRSIVDERDGDWYWYMPCPDCGSENMERTMSEIEFSIGSAIDALADFLDERIA